MVAHKSKARALFTDSIRHTPARKGANGERARGDLTYSSILLKDKTHIGGESCGGASKEATAEVGRKVGSYGLRPFPRI